MAIVKIEDKKYVSKASIKNVVNYVTDYEKTTGKYIGAIGTNNRIPQLMIDQMVAVKSNYEKVQGYRQLRHIIVSFEQNEQITPEMAYFMAYDIARFYSGRYQICFGVHLNTENVHIHFVQNTVSFVDGKLFSGAFYELSQFKQHVNEVEGRYLYREDPVAALDSF